MATSESAPQTAGEPALARLYTVADAARYLGATESAIFWLLQTQSDAGQSLWYWRPSRTAGVASPFPFAWGEPSRHDGLPEDDAEQRFSFRQFADLFLRTAIVQVAEAALARQPDRRQAMKLAAEVSQVLKRQPSFFGDPTSTLEGAVQAIARSLSPWLDSAAEGATETRLVAAADRLVVSNGLPVRLYPFTRDSLEPSPRLIVIDPSVRFGRPVIDGSGIPTDVVFERYQAGDSIADLAEDYDLSAAQIEEAVRMETRSAAAVKPWALLG